MPIRAALVNDTLSDGHFGCRRVVSAIEALCARHDIELVERVPVHDDWRSDPERLRRLESVRLVIVNGEGTIHHDRPSAATLVAVGPHFRDRGIPAALINASWFSNGPALVEQARAFAVVCARDGQSHHTLTRAGIAARHAADLASHAPIPEPARRSGVGFTDSVKSADALALARLRRRHGGVAVNIHEGWRGWAGLRHDLAMFDLKRQRSVRGVAAALEAARSWRSARVTDAATFDARVAGLQLLVTGRFHGAIIGLAAGTPLLAVESNTPKISSTFADVGLEPWRITTPAGVDAALLDRAARWTPTEAERVRDFLADHRRRHDALFADLAALAR